MSKVLVIYFSNTGNVESMAESFKEGVEAAGVEVSYKQVSEATEADINEFEKIAFGCPACGTEELDDTEFEPFFSSIEGQLKDKEVALFGSYGWGDGEYMQTWTNRVSEDGAKLFEEGFVTLEAPDLEVLGNVKDFAERFAKA